MTVSTDRKAIAGLTTETRVHVCPVSYNTGFASTLGYTERSYTVSNCQCTLYTVHGIKTALLNYAILHETELMWLHKLYL